VRDYAEEMSGEANFEPPAGVHPRIQFFRDMAQRDRVIGS
jgi:hypothetical protein